MQWKSQYSTGVSQIDIEHRNLVNMITKLQNSLDEGLITHETGIVLKELVDYTKYHFTSEENFMQQIKFPEYEKHKELHVDLTNQIIEILQNLKKGQRITSIDLIDFLKDWLQKHIIDEDKKIGKYYFDQIENAKKDI